MVKVCRVGGGRAKLKAADKKVGLMKQGKKKKKKGKEEKVISI